MPFPRHATIRTHHAHQPTNQTTQPINQPTATHAAVSYHTNLNQMAVGSVLLLASLQLAVCQAGPSGGMGMGGASALTATLEAGINTLTEHA